MSSPRPTDVTVIVPTLNRPGLLAEALQSIRALERPEISIEILVCDNGSTPETIGVAAEYGARHLRAATLGAAAARNVGLREAGGEFTAFLDDDDRWTGEHLHTHVAMLREREDLGAVVGRVQLMDYDGREPVGEPGPETAPDHEFLFPDFLNHYPQIGATMARRSVLDSIGPFDEALLGDEDWDWHLRLALATRIGFAPVTSVLFRQRAPEVGSDLEWSRFGFFRRVFFRNVRRAGVRSARPIGLARTYLRHAGGYYGYLAQSAEVFANEGRRRSAAKSIWRAFVTSPIHASHDMLRGSAFRNACFAVCWPGRRAAGRVAGRHSSNGGR